MTTDDSFARAVRLHQAGKLAEAEATYRQILAKTPHHADALHLLGVLAGQAEQFDAAIDLISRAIARNPNFASYHCNLGEMYRKTGRLDLAITHARRAVQLNPKLIEAQVILGVALADNGQVDEAINVYRRAIEINPRSFAAYVNLGNALTKKRQFDAAIAAMRYAVELSPNSAAAHFNIGNTLRDAGRIDLAVAAYRRSIELDANFAEAHNGLGDALSEKGRLDEAIAECHRAIELKPTYADAYCNLGMVLGKSAKADDALAAYHHALKIDPNHSQTLNNLGNVLVDKGQIAEGTAAIRRSIAAKPHFATPYYNLGNALRENEQFDEAIAAFDTAIKLMPDYAHAHFNRGLVFLVRGEYAQGWPGYEWRAKTEPMFLLTPDKLIQPKWDGSDLNGRTILLHAEQGFGDTLQSIRYVPEVVKKGGRVIMCIQPELARLLENFPGVEQTITAAQRLPRFDVHCPLMSLSAAFCTELNSIPSQIPYLAPDPAVAMQWKSRVAALPAGLNVGLVWAGSRTHQRDRMRSLSLEQLSPLAKISPVNFISLQKGETLALVNSAEIHLTDWTSDLHDFADTAALVAGLDLAGAMGKKVWILLAAPPDWRWLKDRNDSPWYPTATLFRQKSSGKWDSAIQNVAEALQTEAAPT
jgi:tetratricopeptide (TPR) repeat protein